MRASRELGSAKSQAPAPGRDLGKGAPGDGAPRIQDRASAGRPLGGEALLRRRARGPKNAGIGRKLERREKLSVGAEETTADVVLTKAKPDAHAELLG